MMASRPVVARLDTKKLKPHVENYDVVRKRQVLKKQVSKVTHHKTEKAVEIEDDFDEDEFFFMRTYGENSFTAVKQAHRRTKKLIEHFGREDPTWIENVDIAYRPQEKDFSLKLQDNVLEELSNSIDHMKFQFDEDSSNDFIDKNRIIDPRELVLETQRLRAKDQAKIQTMLERFRTAWTRQELRLKEKLADLKEEAGVGRLSDRLNEREFQLSRLQREVIQKKQFLDIVVRSDVMSTDEQIREALEKSAMDDIKLLQDTIVTHKAELESKVEHEKEIAQRIYSLKTLIANEAVKWKLDATRDFDGGKTLTTLKNAEEAARAALSQLTASLSNNIADITLVLDSVLSQSLKLDGRTTEAKVMNSCSAEFNEIVVLKSNAVRLQREIMEEKAKIKALEDEMTAAGFSTAVPNITATTNRELRSASSTITASATPVATPNTVLESPSPNQFSPTPTAITEDNNNDSNNQYSAEAIDVLASAPVTEQIASSNITPDVDARAEEINSTSKPELGSVALETSPSTAPAPSTASQPATPLVTAAAIPTPPTSARKTTVHRKPTPTIKKPTSRESTSRTSTSSRGSKRSTMKAKSSPAPTPATSSAPNVSDEVYVPSEAVESLLPIFAPYFNLPPSTPLIPVETIGSYTSAADNIPASQKLMRDIEITSKLIHRDRLTSGKRASILGAEEDYDAYGLDLLTEQSVLELISAPEKPKPSTPAPSQDIASDEEESEHSSSSEDSDSDDSDEESICLPQDKLGKDIKKLRSKLSVAENENKKLEEVVEKVQQKVDIVTFKRNTNYKTIMKIIHGDPNKGRQPTLFASEVELGVTRARLNQAKKEEAKWKKKVEQKKIQFDKWLLSRSVCATIAEEALAEASAATIPSRNSSIVISLPTARDICDSDIESDDSERDEPCAPERQIEDRILKPSEMLTASIAESSESYQETEEVLPQATSTATVPSREKSFIASVSLAEALEKIVGSISQPPPRGREESFSRQLLSLSQSPNLELFQQSVVGEQVKPKTKVPTRMSVVTIGDDVKPVTLPPDVQQLLQPQEKVSNKATARASAVEHEAFDVTKFAPTKDASVASISVSKQQQTATIKPWKHVVSTLDGAIGAAMPLLPPETLPFDIITEAERYHVEFDDSRPVTTTPSVRAPQVPSSAPPTSRRFPAMRIDVGTDLGETVATPPKHHRALPPQPLRQHRRIVKPASSVTHCELMITSNTLSAPTGSAAPAPTQLLSHELQRMLSRITDDSEHSSLNVEAEESRLHVVELERELLNSVPPQRVGFHPRKLSIHHKPPTTTIPTSPYRKSNYEPLSVDVDEVVKYRYLSGYASDDDCSYLGVSGALWDRVISVDPSFIKRLLINQVKQATLAAAASHIEEDELDIDSPNPNPIVPCQAPSSPLPTLFEEDSHDNESIIPRTTIQREQSNRSGMLVDFLRAPSPERLKPELVTRNIVYNTLPKRSK